MQFASQAGDDPSFQGNPKSDNGLDPSKIFIPTDKSKQVTKRGWSLDSIKNVMANPAMTRSTADNASIFNRANGNPVTYYYRPDGHYVVIDNQTGQVVQISDTFDPGWIDEMTDKPIHPMQ